MLDTDLNANPAPRGAVGGFNPWVRTLYLPGGVATCETCGKTWRTTTTNARTAHACSGRCRMIAFRRRRKNGANRPLMPMPWEPWKYIPRKTTEEECSDSIRSAS